MNQVNPSTWTDLLVKGGPFALLALLAAAAVYTVIELRSATGAYRRTVARILVFEAVVGIAVAIFTMVVWYQVNVSSTSIITGTMEGLLNDEFVFSHDLFLRPDVNNTYEWKLITPNKYQDGETVDLVVSRPSPATPPPHHIITIKSSFYEKNNIVKLVWHREDGRVFYRGDSTPLPIAQLSPALDWPGGSGLANRFVVWAAQRSAIQAQVPHGGVTSANPLVRESAIRQIARDGVNSVDAIRRMLLDSNPAVVSGAILALNQMDTAAKNAISNGQLLGDASSAIVRAMASDQVPIRQEALRCITWYDRSQVVRTAGAWSKSSSAIDRVAAARVLDTYGQPDAAAILHTARASEKDPIVQRQIDGTLGNMANAAKAVNNAGALKQIPAGRRRDALAVAFQLKDKKISFKWGGKSEAEGFDTSGFAAYVLNKVGVLQNPEKYYSGLLRQTFPSRPAANGTATPQVGDLLFYELGYVTFFLGSDTCIGMTPSGILVQPVDFGPKRLGYGSVPY